MGNENGYYNAISFNHIQFLMKAVHFFNRIVILRAKVTYMFTTLDSSCVRMNGWFSKGSFWFFIDSVRVDGEFPSGSIFKGRFYI